MNDNGGQNTKQEIERPDYSNNVWVMKRLKEIENKSQRDKFYNALGLIGVVGGLSVVKIQPQPKWTVIFPLMIGACVLNTIFDR